MDSWVLSFAQELQGNELRDGRHERKRERGREQKTCGPTEELL